MRTRPTPGARRSQQPSVYTPRNKKPLTPAQKEERERKAALAAQVKMKEQLRNRARYVYSLCCRTTSLRHILLESRKLDSKTQVDPTVGIHRVRKRCR